MVPRVALAARVWFLVRQRVDRTIGADGRATRGKLTITALCTALYVILITEKATRAWLALVG